MCFPKIHSQALKLRLVFDNFLGSIGWKRAWPKPKKYTFFCYNNTKLTRFLIIFNGLKFFLRLFWSVNLGNFSIFTGNVLLVPYMLHVSQKWQYLVGFIIMINNQIEGWKKQCVYKWCDYTSILRTIWLTLYRKKTLILRNKNRTDYKRVRFRDFLRVQERIKEQICLWRGWFHCYYPIPLYISLF